MPEFGTDLKNEEGENRNVVTAVHTPYMGLIPTVGLTKLWKLDQGKSLSQNEIKLLGTLNLPTYLDS